MTNYNARVFSIHFDKLKWGSGTNFCNDLFGAKLAVGCSTFATSFLCHYMPHAHSQFSSLTKLLIFFCHFHLVHVEIHARLKESVVIC